jgi:hypothetical protein
MCRNWGERIIGTAERRNYWNWGEEKLQKLGREEIIGTRKRRTYWSWGDEKP